MKFHLRLKRTKHRLIRHHLVLALVSALLMILLYFAVQSNDILFRWSIATGYTGLALLAATLMTGALNVLRDGRNPISTDLRRDIGIWCGVISLAHVVIGLQVHMGNMLLYFFREAGEAGRLVLRVDLFGFANYSGLLASIIIVFLLALSNDVSLRALGSRRWKALQRWNYALIILVIIHSIAYQVIESRQSLYLVLFGIIVLSIAVFQTAGFRRRRRGLPKAVEPAPEN